MSKTKNTEATLKLKIEAAEANLRNGLAKGHADNAIENYRYALRVAENELALFLKPLAPGSKPEGVTHAKWNQYLERKAAHAARPAVMGNPYARLFSPTKNSR